MCTDCIYEQKRVPGNLVASHPGNQNAVKHGAFAKPLRATRVSEIVEELKRTYNVAEEPALGAFKDYGGLLFMVEQIDQELGTRGVLPRTERGRSLLDLRVRLSRQLQRSRETMLEAVKETIVMSQLRARDEARQPATPQPEPAPREHRDDNDVPVRDDDAFARQLMVRRAQDRVIAAASDLKVSQQRKEQGPKRPGARNAKVTESGTNTIQKANAPRRSV